MWPFGAVRQQICRQKQDRPSPKAHLIRDFQAFLHVSQLTTCSGVSNLRVSRRNLNYLLK